MKRKNNIYFILTYLFFIYPPFIWGLVLIYQNSYNNNEHIVSLIVNIILLTVIALVSGILIWKKKLHVPSMIEIKYLIFGFIGNVVVYFYTFQNIMNIDNYVTIYLILLIVLGVHHLLISHKFLAKELWILMPIFLILDLWHLIGTGCGFADGYGCWQSANTGAFQYVIYSIIILTSITMYSYKVFKINQWDILKYLNAGLIIFISILLQNSAWAEEKITLTIAIMLPFFTILDFIVKIVNKKYSHKMLFHYVRMYTILFIMTLLGAIGFFEGYADEEVLPVMVTVTYVSLFIIIFEHLLKVRYNAKTAVSSDYSFTDANEELKKQVINVFGEVKGNFITLDTDNKSIIVKKDNAVIGFVSCTVQNVIDDIKEIVVDIIEVHPDYLKKGIATQMFSMIEKQSKLDKIHQVRAWTTKENQIYITFIQSLEYLVVPSDVYLDSKENKQKGYQFVKKL